MKKSNNLKLDTKSIVTCALYILIGICLCAFRMGMLGVLFTIIGILFVVYGVYDIIKKNLTQGVVEAAIGVVILICGWTIAKWALIVFGVLLVVKAVLDLLKVIEKKAMNTATLVNIVVNMLIGVILCVAPFALGDILCIIVGVIFILNGVLALFGKKIG